MADPGYYFLSATALANVLVTYFCSHEKKGVDPVTTEKLKAEIKTLLRNSNQETLATLQKHCTQRSQHPICDRGNTRESTVVRPVEVDYQTVVELKRLQIANTDLEDQLKQLRAKYGEALRGTAERDLALKRFRLDCPTNADLEELFSSITFPKNDEPWATQDLYLLGDYLCEMRDEILPAAKGPLTLKHIEVIKQIIPKLRTKTVDRKHSLQMSPFSYIDAAPRRGSVGLRHVYSKPVREPPLSPSLYQETVTQPGSRGVHPKEPPSLSVNADFNGVPQQIPGGPVTPTKLSFSSHRRVQIIPQPGKEMVLKSTSDAENQKLKDAIENLKLERESKENTIESIRQERQHIQGGLAASKEANTEHKQALKNTNDQIAILKIQHRDMVASKNTEIAQKNILLETSKRDLLAVRQEHSQDLVCKQELYAEKENECEILRNQLANVALQSSTEYQSQGRIQSLETSLANAKKALKQREKEVDNLTKEVSRLNTANATLTEAQAEHWRAVEGSRQVTENLQRRLTETVAAGTALQNHFNTLQEQNNRLQQDSAQSSQKIEQQAIDISNLQQIRETLERKVSMLQKSVEAKDEEVARLKSAAKTKAQALEPGDAQKKITALEEQLEKQKGEVKLTKDLHQITADLADKYAYLLREANDAIDDLEQGDINILFSKLQSMAEKLGKPRVFVSEEVSQRIKADPEWKKYFDRVTGAPPDKRAKALSYYVDANTEETVDWLQQMVKKIVEKLGPDWIRSIDIHRGPGSFRAYQAQQKATTKVAAQTNAAAQGKTTITTRLPESGIGNATPKTLGTPVGASPKLTTGGLQGTSLWGPPVPGSKAAAPEIPQVQTQVKGREASQAPKKTWSEMFDEEDDNSTALRQEGKPTTVAPISPGILGSKYASNQATSTIASPPTSTAIATRGMGASKYAKAESSSQTTQKERPKDNTASRPATTTKTGIVFRPVTHRGITYTTPEQIRESDVTGLDEWRLVIDMVGDQTQAAAYFPPIKEYGGTDRNSLGGNQTPQDRNDGGGRHSSIFNFRLPSPVSTSRSTKPEAVEPATPPTRSVVSDSPFKPVRSGSGEEYTTPEQVMASTESDLAKFSYLTTMLGDADKAAEFFSPVNDNGGSDRERRGGNQRRRDGNGGGRSGGRNIGSSGIGRNRHERKGRR